MEKEVDVGLRLLHISPKDFKLKLLSPLNYWFTQELFTKNQTPTTLYRESTKILTASEIAFEVIKHRGVYNAKEALQCYNGND